MVVLMKPPIFVRSFSEEEREALTAGLRSNDAFVLRRAKARRSSRPYGPWTPVGASGAHILTTLVHEMRRRDDVRYGLATMCIGSGRASRWSWRSRPERERRCEGETTTHR